MFQLLRALELHAVPGCAYLLDLLSRRYESKAVKERESAVYAVFQVCNPLPSPRMWPQSKNVSNHKFQPQSLAKLLNAIHCCPLYFAFKSVINDKGETSWRAMTRNWIKGI
jgi:hypothetical protein